MNNLKKVRVADLRIGDHVRKIEGPWLEHGFWRRSFRIKDQRVLDELSASGVEHVWIGAADPDESDSDAGSDDALPHDGGDASAAVAGPDSEIDATVVAESAADESDVTFASGADDEDLLFEPVEDDAPAERPPPRLQPHATPVKQGSSRLHRPDRPSPPSERDWQRAQRVCSLAKRVVTKMFDDVRHGRAIDAEAVMPVVDSVIENVSEQPGTLTSLARLKHQDQYTFMHSVAVCGLMTTLGLELGLDDEAVREAAIAGLVHDIGKMLVPQEILNKPGKLTPEEFQAIKFHTSGGHELLARFDGVGPVALDVVRHHHERLDGKGYPDGLAGDQISLFARMGTVCDVYDAITSDRPYKKAWEPTFALAQMRKWTAGSYDLVVFQAFVKSIGVFPNGSLVRLNSGRLAVVVDQHPSNLMTPMVKVFFSTKSGQPVPRELVDLGASGCREKIEALEDPTRWNFRNLHELWIPVDLTKI
ncbi:MAG: HD-GYP domain-containing protein [Burkholderiaceae bacterium]